MKVTTLKLPPEVKNRIAPLARRLGKTPHAWMVEALKRETERSELREQLIKDSLAAAANIDAGGPVFSAENVHDYILARAAGRKGKRPTALRKKRQR